MAAAAAGVGPLALGVELPHALQNLPDLGVGVYGVFDEAGLGERGAHQLVEDQLDLLLGLGCADLQGTAVHRYPRLDDGVGDEIASLLAVRGRLLLLGLNDVSLGLRQGGEVLGLAVLLDFRGVIEHLVVVVRGVQYEQGLLGGLHIELAVGCLCELVGDGDDVEPHAAA